MNSRITRNERGLIKGAVRRVFSRSELRQQAIEKSKVQHYDPERPRVTKWSMCAACLNPQATYQCQVDHKIPVQEIGVELEDMTWDELVDRIWCDPGNLQVLCIDCHCKKSKLEMKERRKVKKEKLK